MTDLPALPVPKRSALGEAASLLTSLCARIDELAEDTGPGERLAAIDAALIAAFNDTSLQLADAVDRRIGFDIWARGAIGAARMARQEWDDRVQVLKAVYERFKERTKEIVQSNPDVPYKGKLGRLAVQKSQDSVQLVFGKKDVTADMIKYFAIDPQYVKTAYSIDLTALKIALQAGAQVPWATLKTDGSYLRIRK